jgi:glycosyltransferase involved in cell wall biosynthesis
MNGRIIFDMFDLLLIFCNLNNIKIFPIYGGWSIDKYSFLKKIIKAILLKRVDGFFCQSRAELQTMTDKYRFPASRMHYFKNPLDLYNFYPISKNSCAEYLNLDASSRYLLFVGRLSRPKGIQHIINIFPRLYANEPRLRLLIIGEGEYEGALRQQIKETGIDNIVNIMSPVRNDMLKYYYGLSDALLLPSYSEGTPNVLMEAIACNAICIAANVGGIPDLLDGGIGIMVEPKDETALFDAVSKVLEGNFKINQHKRKELLEEIDLNKKSQELVDILMSNNPH